MLLELCGIKRIYPEFTLEAGFSVARDEFFSILGPSGSGKTTLLRLIAGFDRPNAGRILLAGEDITDLPPHRRRIGLVFQDYALFPHLSVGENVAFGLKMKGVPASRRREQVEGLLHLTGLDGFYPRDPSSLSGGEKQRVAVARALAPEPLILLLDEPFSALDQSLRKHLRNEIRDLQRLAGFTALFVTHSQEEAFVLSDRMLVMSTGRVEQIGTPEEVYHSPGSAYVAEFLGEVNSIPASVDETGGTVAVAGQVIALPTDRRWPAGPGCLRFRPEECAVSAEPDDGSWIRGIVLARRFAGSTVSFLVAGEGWTASALHFSRNVPAVGRGDAVWLSLPLGEMTFSIRDP